MTLDCTIMSGAGNIFTVLDNRQASLSVDDGRRLAPVLCSPSTVGRPTEGLMLISPPIRPATDFHMEFFNPDGSHGAMCGNGGRCAVRFAVEVGLVDAAPDTAIRFTVLDTVYTARMHDSSVRLDFPPPRALRFPHSIVLDGVTVQGGYVDVGSDHFVVSFSDLASLAGGTFDTFDITEWGARIRRHPDFAPHGVNANIYTVDNETVRLRTYERGVEAETGACGTGAVSTALIAAMRHDLPSPVRIVPTSGSPLTVHFQTPLSPSSPPALEGDAVILERRTATVPETR